MKNFSGIFTAVFAALWIAGCASSSASPEAPAKEKIVLLPGSAESLAQGREIAAAHVNAFEAALKQGEFAPLKDHMPGVIPARQQRALFAQTLAFVRDKLGELEKSEYLGELDQVASSDYLWRMTFVKKGTPPEPPEIRCQVLYFVQTIRTADGVRLKRAGFRML